MSCGMAAALQSAVYQHLLADAGVSGLVGAAIYDGVPAGDVATTYVSLGPEDVRDSSDKSGPGAVHRFTVSVMTQTAGFAAAKEVAAAITDALEEADLVLNRGRVVGLWFERASARRSGTAGHIRRIDLRFRARMEDN
ncbi:MAG: hypothetical protein ACI92Z_002764 [Paracoccaceae bacterium]|jgi:hypothetical protein